MGLKGSVRSQTQLDNEFIGLVIENKLWLLLRDGRVQMKQVIDLGWTNSNETSNWLGGWKAWQVRQWQI